MAQLLLLPDPRPLDRRLGKKFFHNAPRRPGVYLMRDAQDWIVYVGKGKDLKRRIGNYRVANPDQMPRRHLRMVNEVSRIEFRVCPSESAALETEAKLIRTLKPKFNRAGVWPGKTRFIVWRAEGDRLEIAVAETPEPGWQRFGPMGSSAFAVQPSGFGSRRSGGLSAEHPDENLLSRQPLLNRHAGKRLLGQCATPAGQGVIRIIPISMASTDFCREQQR